MSLTPHDLLLELEPRLTAHCRRFAAQLPGVSADDLFQEAVEEFLRELGRWLQQDATTSVQAQAWTLLRYCLRHARTRAIREGTRQGDLPRRDPDEDPLERVEDPRRPEDRRGEQEILRQVREATTPICALCLLSLGLPVLLEEADASKAKAWKKGGSNAVPRPLPEAWGIYVEGREQPVLVGDDARWRDHVGVAWYTVGPVDALSPESRRLAASKVERYANRGREDLRAVLLGEGGDPIKCPPLPPSRVNAATRMP